MFSKRPPRGPRSIPQQGNMFNPQYAQGMNNPNFFDQEQFSQGLAGPSQMANQSSLYPNTQFERLQFEISENRRRINNLNRRMTRLENYLRIRDNSDYSIEDDRENPGEFSM